MNVTRCVFLWLCFGLTACSLRFQMGYDDIEDYENHPCRRACEDGVTKTCDYDFLIEHYHTMSKACYDCPHNRSACSLPHCVAAEGTPRGLIVANRMMPGPAIHVCEGDTVRVRVHNKMEMSEGTSIHWHGVYQKGTPYMDGVAMITQCPIPAYTAFTYRFKAATPGTHLWHAHSGMQRADGLFGNLVIRQSPINEAHHGVYDCDLPEHTVLVHDWFIRETAGTFAQHHHSDGTNKPDTVLINGRGVFAQVPALSGDVTATTPREEFVVTSGLRYRFRVSSSGIVLCPLRVSVDDHMLEIIATDGAPVEALEVESFDIHAGERYDFVLTANQTSGNYIMRVKGLADCDERFKNASQTALLRYNGTERDNDFLPQAPPLEGKNLNPFNQKASETRIQVTNLTSLLPDDVSLTRKPDKSFTFAMDFSAIDNPRFHNKDLYALADVMKGRLLTPQMNHISMMFPPAPALTQISDIPRTMMCNTDTVEANCTEVFCECIHLVEVDIDDVIEVTLVDEGHPWNAGHPTHLHGYGFRVVAMDKLNDSTWAKEVTAIDRRGGINRRLSGAPLKDTVAVPDGGYTVLRFHANNPGMWFFHCHIEYHAEIGMGVLFQVGKPHQWPATPKGFPTCGNWHPEDDDDMLGGEGEGSTSNYEYIADSGNHHLPHLAIYSSVLVVVAVCEFGWMF